MYLCLETDDRRAPHRQGRNHGREIVHLFVTNNLEKEAQTDVLKLR